MKIKIARPCSRVAIDRYLGNDIGKVGSRSRRHRMSADLITVSWNPASCSPTPSDLSRFGAVLTDVMHGEDSPYSGAVVYGGMQSHPHITFIRRPPSHVIPSSVVIAWPPNSADRSKIGAILKRDARLTYGLFVHDAERPHAHVVFTLRQW